jgi:hypothetical protein
MLEEAYGKAAMKETQVYRLHKRFRDKHKTAGVPSARQCTYIPAVYLAKHNVKALEHPPYSQDLSQHNVSCFREYKVF